jgi:hypothetical protein
MKERTEIKALRAGYYVTQDGTLVKNGQELKTVIDTERGGYKKHHAILNGERFSLKVHRLQAFIKFGELIYQDGIVVRHLNGNPADNSYFNIEIGTPSQNQMDIPEEMRKARVPKHRNYIIGKKSERGDCYYDVEKIVKLRKEGKSLRQISKEMGIKSVGHLSRIINKTAVYRGLL